LSNIEIKKLCRSKEFVEFFWSPDEMGGRWAKNSLEKMILKRLILPH
jgi:hypothetical protein